MPSIWPLISGGRALDTVVKMARSLTSLRSDSHESNQNSANRHGSHDLEAETMKRGDNSIEMEEGLSAPNGEGARKSEIVREDSVEVHSITKSSEEASPGERGFKASCQGGS